MQMTVCSLISKSATSAFALVLASGFVTGCSDKRDVQASRTRVSSTSVAQSIPSPPASDALTTHALFNFTADQLLELETKALSGDGDAANSVAEYYSLRKQWTESDLWVRIGAENGNPNTAQMLARRFWKLGGFHNCLRAIYWMDISSNAYAAIGAQSAADDMASIKSEIERDEVNCLWKELNRPAN
jgi:hypothetical protein